jgi:uncharacterized membrane protein HdeD (DUF308 family)
MEMDMRLRAEGQRALDRTWKAAALRGLVAIGFALALVAWPNIGLAALTAAFGVWALLSGMTRLLESFAAPAPRRRRAWLAVDGVVGVAVGVAVFVWPGLSELGLLYAIAVWALMGGVVDVAVAASSPLRSRASTVLLLTGLVSVAFGVLMLARPEAGAIALLALISAFALVTGVMQVVFAVQTRRFSRELAARSPRPAAIRTVPQHEGDLSHT